MKIPDILIKQADLLTEKTKKVYPSLAPLAKGCFLNTIETTVKICDNLDTYVITGDIPAMWLRDSAAQMKPYIRFSDKSEELKNIMRGLIKRYTFYVNHDSYANAFNEEANNNRWDYDETDFISPYIWERKYETDSLCSVIYFIYDYYINTKDITIFTSELNNMLIKILETFISEQNHSKNSTYFFIRKECPESDTIPNKGKGNKVNYTGMTWSGFRPSDDRCIYNYLVPANMMAVEALKKAGYLLKTGFNDIKTSEKCLNTAGIINKGIYDYGIIKHPKYGEIYAYETDGAGNYILMDDANSPSLLSLPYLGFCTKDDEIYKNTRRFILSQDNPYYFSGTEFCGIGSPHTGKDKIWPLSLIMQIITSDSNEEKNNCLKMLSLSHAGTFFMHESFNKNNPGDYTRPWFAWANSLFAEMLIEL